MGWTDDRTIAGCPLRFASARAMTGSMSWQERTSPIKVGDPVRFSPDWLRSIRAAAGELPRMRGVVTEINPVGRSAMATVDWQDGLAPMKVPVQALRPVAVREVERA